MTSGGGVLVLLHRSAAEELIQKVVDNFGPKYQFYLVFPGPGVGIVDLGVQENTQSVLSTSFLNLEQLKKKAINNFEATYGYRPSRGAYAPSVINLVGDHTDFNHGFAISFALNMFTLFVGAYNGTNKVRVATTRPVGESQKVIFSLPTNSNFSGGYTKWAKFIRGVILNFRGTLKGFDCLVETNLPRGLGLGKTALIVGFYSFLEELTGERTKSSEKAYRCMLAEQQFSSELSGIGGYAISIKAKKNHAVMFDFRTGLCTTIPFDNPSIVILLVFKKTGVKRDRNLILARVGECYEVAWAYGARTLRCLTREDLKAKPHRKVNKTYIKRAKHIIDENERVLKAAEALKNNDFEDLGEILVDSHNSLKKNYEVSNIDLDCLIQCAMEVDGVIGSKMPCSGYLNSTLTLVKRWAVDDLIEYLKTNYSDPLDFFIVEPSQCCESINIADYINTLPHQEHLFERIFSL